MQKLKQQQFFDRIFDRLPDHVTLLLIIISGFLLARLTWMMFPSDPALMAALEEQPSQNQGVAVIQAHATRKDLGKEIAGYHLLGVYKPPQAAPKPQPVKQVVAPPPPKPRVPIDLVGVYALGSKEGIAIINVKGKQQVVGLGEAIGDSGATLHRVHADHVEVSWDGVIEKLNMPNIGRSDLGAIQIPAGQQPQPQPVQPIVQPAALNAAATNNNAANAAAGNSAMLSPVAPNANGQLVTDSGAQQPLQGALVDPAQNANNAQANGRQNQQNAGTTATQGANNGAANGAGAKVSLGSFRQEILNNNINLLQVVRPSPRRQNGKLIGFAVRPGTNRALFNQTGLRSGDVVTAINGMPLTNNASSRQAMQALTTASGATLNVMRAGQETTVNVAF